MEVYHYTSGFGLLGILNSMNLWATHFQYLNDQSEFFHAKDIIINTVEESANKFVLGHKQTLKVCLDQIYDIYNIYTCSFSKEPDQLTQWRAYCPDDGGFSLGFNIEELIKVNGDNFFECIYGIDEKKENIKPLIERFCENCEKLTRNEPLEFSDQWKSRFESMVIKPYEEERANGNLDLEKNHIEIRYELASLAARMKDFAFKDENEIRYIYVSSNSENSGVKFRNKNSLIIPYRIIDINSNALQSITIGPGINKDLNKNSLELLGRDLDIKFEIIKSEIPYRGW